MDRAEEAAIDGLYRALLPALDGEAPGDLAQALAALPPPARAAGRRDAALARWLAGAPEPQAPAEDSLEDQPAPEGWPELADWAAARASLAWPGKSAPAALLGRARDLLRGVALDLLVSRAQLAAIERAARLVRWLAVLPLDGEQRGLAAAAATTIAARAALYPQARFHAGVALRSLRD